MIVQEEGDELSPHFSNRLVVRAEIMAPLTGTMRRSNDKPG